jgi:putative heme transporter
MLITGMWNNLIKLGLPVLALGLLALQGDASGSRTAGAMVAIGLIVAAVTLFALILRSDRVASGSGELAGRVASQLRRLLRRPAVQGWGLATVNFRSRANELLRQRWPAITAAALVSHLSLYLVLLIGGLVAAGGQQDEVAAAVLVFRALTWLLPVPIGTVTYLAWRRHQAQRRSLASDATPAVPVEPGSPSI